LFLLVFKGFFEQGIISSFKVIPRHTCVRQIALNVESRLPCIIDVKTFLERAEAYLSPLLVKPKLVCNKFQLSEATIPITPLCQFS
jgi:hypothetical protein